MGSRMVRFNFTPDENEQIEAVVKLPEEKRSIIHGIVKDHKNKIVKDAVVKLFEVMDPHEKCALKPITHTFTDECGQFMFGPLMACKHYAIKVWINNVKVRVLIIHPDDCPKQHDHECDHDRDDFEYEDKECEDDSEDDCCQGKRSKGKNCACDDHKHHFYIDDDEENEFEEE